MVGGRAKVMYSVCYVELDVNLSLAVFVLSCAGGMSSSVSPSCARLADHRVWVTIRARAAVPFQGDPKLS